jgi:reverse transcriptase-like protein
MLPATIMRRLEALTIISKQGKRLNGLFRLMKAPILWHEAYANIYANEGATTPGIDEVTLDGFSEERVTAIITRLKNGTYRFKPTRRTYIPKKSGKKRPLGISSGDDKLVQEVVRIILERIYEPIFGESSHGFRPERSPHSALQYIDRQGDAVKWWIDMDIRDYFTTIDHDLLMILLQKKIEDKRFLCLIQAMLKAGYLEDWTYHARLLWRPSRLHLRPDSSECVPPRIGLLHENSPGTLSTRKRAPTKQGVRTLQQKDSSSQEAI